jgi:hypothetical protein
MLVDLFSARKVGPNVYTSPTAQVKASALNCTLAMRVIETRKGEGRMECRIWRLTCPETVRNVGFPKNSRGAVAAATGGSEVVTDSPDGGVEIWNISPAPSQSEEVMMGVWMWRNPSSWKNWCVARAKAELIRVIAPKVLVLGRRWPIVRKNSKLRSCREEREEGVATCVASSEEDKSQQDSHQWFEGYWLVTQLFVSHQKRWLRFPWGQQRFLLRLYSAATWGERTKGRNLTMKFVEKRH